jgi:hypothetical protein
MSTRNFDASVVTQRNNNKVLAQNIIRSQLNGKTIVSNPQNSNGSWSVIPQVKEGIPATYQESLTGYTTSDISGTANLYGTPAVSAPVPPPVTQPAFIPTSWIDATGVDFSSAGRGIAYGNGKWIAVGLDNTATVKSSSDNGVTWTNTNNLRPDIGNGTGLYGIATDGNGKWVAVGNENTAPGGITIIFSSDDGVTWAASANGFNSFNGTTDRGWAVGYGNGKWMAVGHYSVGVGYERLVKVATTFDPVTGPVWVDKPSGTAQTPVRFGGSNPALCVAYGNGRWCIGGQDMNSTPQSSIMYSDNDGDTWTKATNSFKGMCYGIATDSNNNWVAVGYLYTGDTKSIKYSSDNGATWTDTASLSGNIFTTGYSVTYQPLSTGSIWVATGSGNSQTILYSGIIGYSWSAAGSNRFLGVGYDVYFNVDRWIAVGNGGVSSIKYSLS